MKGHPTVKPPCFGEALERYASKDPAMAECEKCFWLEECVKEAILKAERGEGESDKSSVGLSGEEAERLRRRCEKESLKCMEKLKKIFPWMEGYQ